MPRLKQEQFNINNEAFEVVNMLMDTIERLAPEYYSSSDEIARAEDFLVILENEPDFQALERERIGDICPNCGGVDFFRNSSGDIQCGCGFDEGNDEAKSN